MRLLLRRFPASGGLQLFVLLCAMMAGAPSLRASTITVTTTADSGGGSLRAAIAAASNGDTIQFDPALNGQSIMLTSGELMVDKNITIDGPGANQLAVKKSSGSPNFRIFHVVPSHNVTIKGLTIDGNGTIGAGVWNDQAGVALDGCVVQGCLGEGGVLSKASFDDDSYLTVVNSTIRNNQADVAGGGIHNEASAFNHAILSIRNSVVSNNSAGISDSASGGGIWNSGEMDITNSVVSNNVSGGNGPLIPFGNGGGISNQGGALMFIANCTISGNSAGLFGGGIYNLQSAQLTGSTVSGNIASGVNDLEGWGDGAGIYNGSSMTITNSTLSNNNSTHYGGAVSNRGSLTIRHSTLSGNNAFEGGTIVNYNGATIQIGNTALKVSTFSSISNHSGTITSNGYNLINDNGSGFFTATGDQTNTEPMLGPLQNNGGPTFTHELLTGSPAIDMGNPNFAPPPSNDQRGPGFARVFNGRIDIGSVEVQPTSTPTPTPTATPTPCPLFTITGTVGQCTTAGPSGIALPGVTMTRTDIGGSTTTTTDGSGNYTVFVLQCSTPYTVTPSKAARPPASAGINTADVLAVQRHFLTISLLAGCRLAAADCASPAGVTTTDIIAIQRFFLGQTAGTGNVGQYSFTPANRVYSLIFSNQTAQNYDAIVFGDVASPFAAP